MKQGLTFLIIISAIVTPHHMMNYLNTFLQIVVKEFLYTNFLEIYERSPLFLGSFSVDGRIWP